ncbi:MAG: chemotaxis protein CheB [Bacteroidales bacterium]|nr:chemotaxis protein CheB [Bacteroidales bacterium]
MKYIVIGGSAGSFQTVSAILANLPKNYPHAVFLCLHRLKNVRGGFVEALSLKSNIPVCEPFDKDQIVPGIAYLAPANYHLYVTNDGFSLTTEEAINHSRPSIDVTFFSLANTKKNDVVGILLSGANKDGAAGIKSILDAGGKIIVQSPDECQVKTMPLAAIKLTSIDYSMNTKDIIDFLKNLKG